MTEKKTLDGWAMLQSLFIAIITASAIYVATQINNLNESVNELNKNMSAAVTDISNQKETLFRHDQTFEKFDSRIRALETKTP